MQIHLEKHHCRGTVPPHIHGHGQTHALIHLFINLPLSNAVRMARSISWWPSDPIRKTVIWDPMREKETQAACKMCWTCVVFVVSPESFSRFKDVRTAGNFPSCSLTCSVKQASLHWVEGREEKREVGKKRAREKERRGNGRVDSSAFMRRISPSVFPGGAEETAKKLLHTACSC